MAEFAREVLPVNLEDEMRHSYMDYAMSVIVGRALPDVRDGLKPVHRRVLFAMSELGNDWNKAYKKSARVVGDVIGKYHPHGDTAVYDTIVRMAQPFSMRYMLVDGQGNFGSVDGDAPAAMRYTEVRMARIAHELQADIDKETVDFTPNYDGSEREPAVFPTRIPNLLVNGSTGIAVGMATNIPPHNITEVLNACVALIDDPELSEESLFERVPGPDFPTAGIINGAAGIREAYRTGRGRVFVRARAHFEDDERSGKTSIIVTELPYQVNKARLIERIAELVKEKKIEGITELRDESDKDGMRIVIELRRGEMGDVMLNNLYQHTAMQSVFGINMVALVDGQPRLLGLRAMLEAFIRHRREVVTRRTVFDLRKARERGHILEGLAVALANIDEIIAVIKAAPSPAEAREGLLARRWSSGLVRQMLERAGATASRPDGLGPEFGLGEDGLYRLSAEQAQAILELRLHRLTGLEQDKILDEYRALLAKIDDLLDILANPERLMREIRDELLAMREQYGDARRTEIVATHEDLDIEDLIAVEDRVVTLSREGYVKAQSLSEYATQRRGGRGKAATKMKDEDTIERLLVASTHDMVLLFTSAGRVYWKKVWQFPQGGRGSRGRPIVNLLPLAEGERVNAMLPVRDFEAEAYIFLATREGVVKKTPLKDFSRPRPSGIIAVDIREGDSLIGAAITDGDRNIMLFSDAGKAICFHEGDVRPMGRTATGVRGMRLGEGQGVVSLIVPEAGCQVLTATENGFGKRTPIDDYPVHGRGGQGVIAIQTSERNGRLVAAVSVAEEDGIMLISDAGTLVRTAVSQVSSLSRNTQGVTLIRLSEGESLVQVERIQNVPGADEAEAEASPDEGGDAGEGDAED
ncbi:MAG: DNA gyrase subunit A [Halothiobacillaceae bacterium]|jgi:DNA gyrase subunit A|nr:DNA gyrase subunit A [Halothiobacillaceae bacterium]MDY0049222.1 DNA gyrase subunit A [Halothiobacillaceae bacterium]